MLAINAEESLLNRDDEMVLLLFAW